MTKKTALTVFLCFVCVAVIGVCAIAGISKWTHHQAELERQEILDEYTAQLSEMFDELYDIETELVDRMAEQQETGMSDQQVIIDTINTIRTPLDQLASVEAPEELAEAQQYFAAAAESYSTIADTVINLLSDDTQDAEALKSAIIGLMPDAVRAFDQIKYGIDVLEESGANVPDSAKQLTEALDSLVDSGVDRVLTTDE